MHLFPVQMSVADQFAVEKEHRDLVAEARARSRVPIHVDHVHREARGGGQRRERREHLLAQPAAGTGVQDKSQWEGSSAAA